jgi:hypothetical protein
MRKQRMMHTCASKTETKTGGGGAGGRGHDRQSEIVLAWRTERVIMRRLRLLPADNRLHKLALRNCGTLRSEFIQQVNGRCADRWDGAPAAIGIWDPYKIPGNCSKKNPRSAQLEDGSRAFLPQRSSPSPSQRRQLDNFNYLDDGGIADRRGLR